MYKACSRCGKVHNFNGICPNKRTRYYQSTEERKLRSSNKWKEKSLEIRERANHLCEVCRDNNIFTYDNIEVHHIIKIRDDTSKMFDNENLICLCVEHHKQADRNEIDSDYLRQLASRREGII